MSSGSRLLEAAVSEAEEQDGVEDEEDDELAGEARDEQEK